MSDAITLQSVVHKNRIEIPAPRDSPRVKP